MEKALVKGLQLMECLAASPNPRGITDLAAETQLTRSNVHRIVTTLRALGYVRQVPETSAYELTTRVWELGSQVIRRLDLIKVARPAMQALAEATRETIHLSVLDGLDVVYVDKIEGSQHIRAHTSVGGRAPAYTVATGKAMLAQRPDSYMLQFGPTLRRYTPATRTRIEDLQRDIEEVRRCGYAVVPHGEWREGIAACAAAILGGTGELVGAIGMSGPDTRLGRSQIQAVSADVVGAARRVSAALGYLPAA
ncbi:IclR family transcriptional regulator [Acidimangrovimonas sediminis]|uniref:IclR family transcriptional regulator n=1 Tax=Acidimangrovimonas sediminis TaxID=2056283 RepID=UPI000C807946|nr:IclR family transcriptional regulator [Acidimangrovimonas sediminis]